MDARAALQAWRDILPACVCVSAGPLLNDTPRLTAYERASVGVVDAQRIRELENGRVYAKCALAILGMRDVELPIAPDRAPLWPEGVVGSLTHVMTCAGGHFAVAVARTRAVCAVGIDVECEGGLHPHTWNFALTAREQERILALPPQLRGREALVIWCAKEATAKAARRPIDPTDVEIERNPTGDRFSATWRAGRGGAARVGEIWHGRTARLQGFIFAAVVLLRVPGYVAYRSE